MKPLHRRALLAILAVAAPLALLGACEKGGPGASKSTSRDAGRKLRVGFAQVGAESEWRKANTDSIKSEAAARGIDLIFVDAQGQQEKQISAIRSFIAQGVDVIAFAPKVETGWEPVLKEVKAAGIPVILTDRVVDVEDPGLYATFIGADFVEEGRRAAEWLVNATNATAQIAELQGSPGSAPAIDRKKGFEEVISKHPGMEIIKSQSGDFGIAKGREVMESFLKSPDGKRITAVYAHNDDMALGAAKAMEEAGVKPGVDIKIVSIDGGRAAFQAMIDGKLNCTVECNPLLGPQLFDAAEALAAGKPVERRVVTKAVVFDQTTAAEDIKTRKY